MWIELDKTDKCVLGRRVGSPTPDVYYVKLGYTSDRMVTESISSLKAWAKNKRP